MSSNWQWSNQRLKFGGGWNFGWILKVYFCFRRRSTRALRRCLMTTNWCGVRTLSMWSKNLRTPSMWTKNLYPTLPFLNCNQLSSLTPVRNYSLSLDETEPFRLVLVLCIYTALMYFLIIKDIYMERDFWSRNNLPVLVPLDIVLVTLCRWKKPRISGNYSVIIRKLFQNYFG